MTDWSGNSHNGGYGSYLHVAGMSTGPAAPYYVYNVPAGAQSVTVDPVPGYSIYHYAYLDAGGDQVWHPGTGTVIVVPDGSAADLEWVYAPVAGSFTTLNTCQVPTGQTTCGVFAAWQASDTTDANGNPDTQVNVQQGGSFWSGATNPPTPGVDYQNTASNTGSHTFNLPPGTYDMDLYGQANGNQHAGWWNLLQDASVTVYPPPSGSFSATGCTLPAGGGTCNVLLTWKVAGTNSGKVDLYGTDDSGNVLTGFPMLGLLSDSTQSVPISVAGVYHFKLLNNGSTSDTMSLSPDPIDVTVGNPPGTLTGSCASDSGCVDTTSVQTSNPNSGPTITAGSCVNLNWSCPAPYRSSAGANFSTGGATSGTAKVCPSSTTSYTLQCNPFGTQTSLTVATIQSTIALTASPARVRSGSASSLNWSASAVSSCVLTGPGGFYQTNNADSNGNVGPITTPTSSIFGQSTYKISCQTSAGTISSSVTVSLVPAFQER